MDAFCRRCEDRVAASYPDPKLRRWVRGYFLLGLPFIPLLPIIGSDFAVMLPLTMLYLFGLGPALRVIREPALCDACGAQVEAAGARPATPTP